jgi:tetratricopeptide (TPR) repeat protein
MPRKSLTLGQARRRPATVIATNDPAKRRAASNARVEFRRRTLPEGLDDLRELADSEATPEDAIAVNAEILRRAPDDVVAMIRLGRAYKALGQLDQAVERYQTALAVQPANRVADRRLREAIRAQERRNPPR